MTAPINKIEINSGIHGLVVLERVKRVIRLRSLRAGQDKARGPLTRPLRPFVLFVLSFPLDAAIGLDNGALPRLYLGPTALYFCLLVLQYGISPPNG